MLRSISVFLLLPAALLATDLRPWYFSDLQLLPSISWEAHIYDKVDAEGPDHYSDFGQFVNFGVGGSYTNLAAEIEIIFADTRAQDFGFDHARITGRYQWCTDDLGDPVALTTGITLIPAVSRSVKDITSFHHSAFEGELHIAVGKQCITEEFWTSRWWTLAALGLSDHGSPWIRANLNYEKNYWNSWQWGVFCRTLWGLGKEDLDLREKFTGYGDIDHKSIDIGGRYAYWSKCYGEISLEYSYRVYARNFPEQMHLIRLQILYPLSLCK